MASHLWHNNPLRSGWNWLNLFFFSSKFDPVCIDFAWIFRILNYAKRLMGKKVTQLSACSKKIIWLLRLMKACKTSKRQIFIIFHSQKCCPLRTQAKLGFIIPSVLTTLFEDLIQIKSNLNSFSRLDWSNSFLGFDEIIPKRPILGESIEILTCLIYFHRK